MAAPPPILITSMDQISSVLPERLAAIVSFELLAARNLVDPCLSASSGRDPSCKFLGMTRSYGLTLNRVEPRELQRGRFWEPAADVESLHRLARRTLHQIV